MNTRLYLFSIVAVLILTVGPHAIGKIDPATVAGLWLLKKVVEISQQIVPMLETTVLLRDQRNGNKANLVERWNSTVVMSMLRWRQ